MSLIILPRESTRWTRQPQRGGLLTREYSDALIAHVPSLCPVGFDLTGKPLSIAITAPARAISAGGVNFNSRSGDRPYLQTTTPVAATGGMTLISVQAVNMSASANNWHKFQNTATITHFPFSSLWYASTFSTSRWLNGVSIPTTTGTPHVAIVTAEGTNRAAYINGQLVGSSSSGGSIDITTQIFYGSDEVGYNWDGDFFGFFLLPRSLTAAEIARKFQTPAQAWGSLIQKKPRQFFLQSAGGGGVTGTAAITLAGATSSATGTTTVKGSAALTLGNATSSATGVVGSVSGTAAITLGNDTSLAQGTTSIGGTGAVTLGNDTCSASGAVGSAITGTAAITLGNDTSSAQGTTKILGSAAITLGADFSTTQGTTKILGSAAITLGDDFATAFGTSGTPTTVSSPRGLTIRIGLAL